MKRKKHSIFILSVVLILLVYQSCTIAATAADAEPVPELSDTTPDKPVADVAAVVPDKPADGVAVVVPDKPADDSADIEPDKSAGDIADMQSEESAQEDAADSIHSGAELTEWLDSHMYTGGTARLEDNIILDEYYNFFPWAGCPDIIVETGGYTVTVSEKVELLSDGHLTFQGTGGEQGIFYVKSGGGLILDGVNVKRLSEGYALWQEEGAGLVVANSCENCNVTVSGNIHYADRPFVAESENVCVIIEKDQSLQDVLPPQIICKRVIDKGKSLFNEPMAVSWNLEETGEWQERRQRFSIQGSFTDAEADTLPVCTVVYDDYPLTFTKAEAFVRGGAYTFRGGYTKPETELPITVEEAYSLDGENWSIYRSNPVQDADESFYILCPYGECNPSQHPYIYIRLRSEINGKEYISNILRYETGNLDIGEDIGGGRGGGTAVVNPPSEPVETPVPLPSDNIEASDGQTSNEQSPPDNPQTPHEQPSSDNPQTPYGYGQPSPENTQPAYAQNQSAADEAWTAKSFGPYASEALQTSIQPIESELSEGIGLADESESREAASTAESESLEAASTAESESREAAALTAESESREATALTDEAELPEVMLLPEEQSVSPDIKSGTDNKRLIIAACFTLSSAIIGAAAYYLFGTKR